jgi:hypothetical protein
MFADAVQGLVGRGGREGGRDDCGCTGGHRLHTGSITQLLLMATGLVQRVKVTGATCVEGRGTNRLLTR